MTDSAASPRRGDDNAVATASTTGPVTDQAASRVLPVLLLPAGISLAAVLLGASFGHLRIGVMVAVGVALGLLNGLLMERATAKITPESDHERRDVVKSSLGRLALITGVALLIAILARPDGWALLASLACYQILMTLSQLGAAAREAQRA
jgi:hypothetical protein